MAKRNSREYRTCKSEMYSLQNINDLSFNKKHSMELQLELNSILKSFKAKIFDLLGEFSKLQGFQRDSPYIDKELPRPIIDENKEVKEVGEKNQSRNENLILLQKKIKRNELQSSLNSQGSTFFLDEGNNVALQKRTILPSSFHIKGGTLGTIQNLPSKLFSSQKSSTDNNDTFIFNEEKKNQTFNIFLSDSFDQNEILPGENAKAVYFEEIYSSDSFLNNSWPFDNDNIEFGSASSYLSGIKQNDVFWIEKDSKDEVRSETFSSEMVFDFQLN